jgi:hypothetical protein
MADNGGPAFPVGDQSTHPLMVGMSLLDYFAGQATEQDIEVFIPSRVSGAVKVMRQLGILGPALAGTPDGYGPNDMARLRAWARYQHAAAMLAEKAKREKDA